MMNIPIDPGESIHSYSTVHLETKEEFTEVTKVTSNKIQYKINGISKCVQIYSKNRVKAADYASENFIKKF
jgi:hypothetical protein